LVGSARVTLARALWKENANLAAAALAHPLVRGIANGSLPRDTFADYVAQDAFFLHGFARAYTRARAQTAQTRRAATHSQTW